MPTYDYECQSCGHRFEHFAKLHDAALRVCPKCGKKKSKRQIGAGAGFIFKGSGFHVTDYKSSGGGGGDAAPRTDSKTGSTPESKPKKKKAE